MNALARLFHSHKISIALFLSVGALSALVYFLSFTLFWKLFGWNYKISISFAYFLSVVTHFTGNRNLTFKSYGVSIPLQVAKYLLMVATNYAITLIVAHIVVEILKLSPYISIVCSIGATVSTGYLMSRFWVFKKLTA